MWNALIRFSHVPNQAEHELAEHHSMFVLGYVNNRMNFSQN